MNVNQQLWTEKYRPDSLDEVVGHEVAVQKFRDFTDEAYSGGLPHLILHGPPGVGKTAVAMAWAEEYYGDTTGGNVREFNASDERGIDVIRDKIKGWCRTSPSGGYSFKIVFLDEADQLTPDAQAALRRTMERFSDNTRFILTCNYLNQVIDPLQSRCATFHFGEVDDDEVRGLLAHIIEQEGIEAEPSAVDALTRAARGRPRDAVVSLRTSLNADGELTEENVELVTGVVDDALVRDIFEDALQGDHDDAMERFDTELLKAGANSDLLIDSCFRVLQDLDMPDDSRIKCFNLLAEIDERIHSGLNPHVQFHALLGHVHIAQGLSVYEQQGGEGQ